MKNKTTLISRAKSGALALLFIFCGHSSFSQTDTLHINYDQVKTIPHDTSLAKIDAWVKKLNGMHVDVNVIAYYSKIEFKKYAQERADEMFLVLNRKARSLVTIESIGPKKGENSQRSRVDIVYKKSVSAEEKAAIAAAIAAEKAAADKKAAEEKEAKDKLAKEKAASEKAAKEAAAAEKAAASKIAAEKAAAEKQAKKAAADAEKASKEAEKPKKEEKEEKAPKVEKDKKDDSSKEEKSKEEQEKKVDASKKTKNKTKSSANLNNFPPTSFSFSVSNSSLKPTLGAESDIIVYEFGGLDENNLYSYFLTYASKTRSNEFDLNLATLNNASLKSEKHIVLPDVNKNKMYFAKLVYIENQPYLFSRSVDEKKYTNTLYVTKVKPDATLDTETKQIDQIVHKETFYSGAYGIFHVISSPNKKLLMVVRFLPFKQNTFNCIVFDKNLNQVWQKNFELAAVYDYLPYTNFILTNEGNVYFKGQVAKEKALKVKGKPDFFTYVFYYEQKNDKLNQLKIELPDFFVQSDSLKISNNKVIIAGLYSNKYFAAQTAFSATKMYIVDGAYWAIVNDNCTEILKSGSMDFADQIISDYKLEFTTQRLKDLYLMNDGGVTLVSERYLYTPPTGGGNESIRDKMAMKPGPLFSSEDYSLYMFDYILITKMHDQNNLNWTKQIKKNQNIKNDPGLGSFVSMSNGDDIHIIFNQRKEILESTDSIQKKASPKFGVKENILTWQMTYDKSGKVIGNQPFFKSNPEYFIVPTKTFKTSNNEMIFLSTSQKGDRFGKINYNK